MLSISERITIGFHSRNLYRPSYYHERSMHDIRKHSGNKRIRRVCDNNNSAYKENLVLFAKLTSSSWRYHGTTPDRYIKQVEIGANNEYCDTCFTGQYPSFWLTSWRHDTSDFGHRPYQTLTASSTRGNKFRFSFSPHSTSSNPILYSLYVSNRYRAIASLRLLFDQWKRWSERTRRNPISGSAAGPSTKQTTRPRNVSTHLQRLFNVSIPFFKAHRYAKDYFSFTLFVHIITIFLRYGDEI